MNKANELPSHTQSDVDGSDDPASPARRRLICSAIAAGALVPLAGAAQTGNSYGRRARRAEGYEYGLAVSE